jgi:hypothetical protein
MPAAQQQNGRNGGFDRKQFHEILQRFNAETVDEVDAAFCDALRICDRLRMPFSEVVQRIYGQNEMVIDLNDRLAEVVDELKARVQERTNLVRVLTEVQNENGRLRAGARYCRGCEHLRRILACIAGFILCASWLRWVPAHGVLFWTPALALAVAPVAFTWCRWHWRMFRRKVKWVSWKTNDLVSWWKGLP